MNKRAYLNLLIIFIMVLGSCVNNSPSDKSWLSKCSKIIDQDVIDSLLFNNIRFQTMDNKSFSKGVKIDSTELKNAKIYTFSDTLSFFKIIKESDNYKLTKFLIGDFDIRSQLFFKSILKLDVDKKRFLHALNIDSDVCDSLQIKEKSNINIYFIKFEDNKLKQISKHKPEL